MKSQRESVAVIGAGIAGLTAARELQSRGFEVRLFDKGRTPGGRVCTRRYDDARGHYAFDHGAQYFTVKNDQFAELTSKLVAEGRLAPWVGRFGSWNGTSLAPELVDKTRLVGTPGMSALPRALSSGLNVNLGDAVSRCSRSSQGWQLMLASGTTTERFDELILAMPDAQVKALLENSNLNELAAKLPEPALAPCWAVLLAFDGRTPSEFDGIFSNAGLLSWAARDSSKPGRESRQECWVLHLDPTVSATRLNDTPDFIARDAIDALQTMLGRVAFPSIVFQETHRWRYASIGKGHNERSLHFPNEHMGFCGDWLSGGRVEGAFLSGLDLASRISGT